MGRGGGREAAVWGSTKCCDVRNVTLSACVAALPARFLALDDVRAVHRANGGSERGLLGFVRRTRRTPSGVEPPPGSRRRGRRSRPARQDAVQRRLDVLQAREGAHRVAQRDFAQLTLVLRRVARHATCVCRIRASPHGPGMRSAQRRTCHQRTCAGS
eukprot:scaffold4613_cov129-Isochrysis_galbana.AAC.22